MNLAFRSIFVQTSKGYLTCRKILRHGANGFTSPPKEDVLRIFIAVKYFSLGRVEAANLVLNSKHANHNTTDDDTF
jgi:hypothetical protein